MDSSNMALYMKTRRAERRKTLLDMRGNSCENCGSVETLEFNHKDRSTKSFTLSGCALDRAWTRILEELNKCELLCSTCHLDYTRGQYSNGEITPYLKNRKVGTGEVVILGHGMSKMYEAGCRCDDCIYAKSLYRKKLIGFTDKVTIPR